MPGMNGRKLAETVQERHPKIKIIFMSGYTEQALDQETISSDSNLDFLSKPISIKTLLDKVREVIDR